MVPICAFNPDSTSGSWFLDGFAHKLLEPVAAICTHSTNAFWDVYYVPGIALALGTYRWTDQASSLSSWRNTLILRQSGFNLAPHPHMFFSHMPSLCHQQVWFFKYLNDREGLHTPTVTWPDATPTSFSVETSCPVFSYKIYFFCLGLSVAEISRQVSK